MTRFSHARLPILLAVAIVLPLGGPARAFQPTRFTFTPTFQDPDPGLRHWDWNGSIYTETLPSGRRNTFRLQKPGSVHGVPGFIVQKVEEPNFFVFIADSEAPKKQLWWWRDKGPWNFMGMMRNIIAPVRID